MKYSLFVNDIYPLGVIGVMMKKNTLDFDIIEKEI
jgi:hypothetical protein